MRPNPDERYQTAAEMLWDFEHLHDNDPRTKQYKRQKKLAVSIIACLLLAGGTLSFAGLKMQQQNEMAAREDAEKQAEIERIAKENERIEKEREENAKSALEEISSAKAALEIGNVELARDFSRTALERDTQYNSMAQKTLTDALGVYDLSEGFKAHLAIELPSEPLKAVLSPSGTRIAAIYAWTVAVFDTDGAEKIAEFSVEPSALSDVVFLDDEKIAYASQNGISVAKLDGTILWTGEKATGIGCSENGNRLACIYKGKSECNIYDAATGELIRTLDFGNRHQQVPFNTGFADPEDNILSLSSDGRWLAISFAEGGLSLFDLSDEDGEVEIYEESDFKHFEGGFSGEYFAFCADSGSESAYTLVSLTPLGIVGSMSSTTPFHIQADESGIFLSNENVLVRFDPKTFEQAELAYTDKDIAYFRYGDAYSVVIDEDGNASVFDRNAQRVSYSSFDGGCNFAGQAGDYAFSASRDTPILRLQKLESHEDARIFRYDPSIEHREARVGSDGATVMLFDVYGFSLFAMSGNLLTTVKFPDAGSIYDQQYRRSDAGDYLEVTYYDGKIIEYSAKDGTVVQERQEERPDESLYEEFLTDGLRITAPLHETPIAYNKNTGEVIKELEKDAYLTYVTQVGDYVVTEYISAQGARYGILLDENCDTIAYLPYLCDVVNDQLIFDYPTGELRTSRIYSTQELIALAK